MRTETNYYCEICGSCHLEAEDALTCEESHKDTDNKPKYNEGDLLHYVDPKTGLDIYFTFENTQVTHWDAARKSWIYKCFGNKMPEDAINLEMTNEERMKRIDAIKANLEPDCHDISVIVDSTEPRFLIGAYWSKTGKSNGERLPKFTVEAFSLPQCPEWAKYAAVDEDGIVCYYMYKPYIVGGRWYEPTTYGKVQTLYDERNQYIRYDASDWEHSLIEHPAAASAAV